MNVHNFNLSTREVVRAQPRSHQNRTERQCSRCLGTENHALLFKHIGNNNAEDKQNPYAIFRGRSKKGLVFKARIAAVAIVISVKTTKANPRLPACFGMLKTCASLFRPHPYVERPVFELPGNRFEPSQNSFPVDERLPA